MIYNYESAHLHLTVGVKTVLETVKLSSGLPDEAFKQLKQFEAKQRAVQVVYVVCGQSSTLLNL